MPSKSSASQKINCHTGTSLGLFQEGCGEQMWSTFLLSNNLFRLISNEISKYFYGSIVALRRGALHPLSKFSGCRRNPRTPSYEALHKVSIVKSWLFTVDASKHIFKCVNIFCVVDICFMHQF